MTRDQTGLKLTIIRRRSSEAIRKYHLARNAYSARVSPTELGAIAMGEILQDLGTCDKMSKSWLSL